MTFTKLRRPSKSLRRPFRSLSVPNYRRYFVGQVISISGNWMQTVGEMWLVLRLTNSATAVGITTALQFTHSDSRLFGVGDVKAIRKLWRCIIQHRTRGHDLRAEHPHQQLTARLTVSMLAR